MLEQIVRPFETPNALSRRKIVANNTKIEVGTAIISWGKAGQIAAAHEIDAIDDSGSNFTVDLIDEEYTEESRKTDVRRITQRITNADGSVTTNEDNYVDLDRPYQVTFKKEELDSKGPNQTQVWSTSIETAGYSTVNPNNKTGKSKFNLNRNLS